LLNVAACAASTGTDYQVGAGKAYTSLDLVPWESLNAGDTVRIFYSATPYKGKFTLFRSGTVSAPIRVCGMPGPNGERPIIEGNGAVTRRALSSYISGTASTRQIYESRAIISIKNDANTWTSFPQYVQIDGLNIRSSATPGTTQMGGLSYTDSTGAAARYGLPGGGTSPDPFTACIWMDRGHNITIANNEISGCPMAIYTKSVDDGVANTSYSITQNIRIAGNYMWGAGVPGDVHEHTTYTESEGIVIEFNHYGVMQASDGNSLKDRSAGLVVRYNYVEDGAHALDLVEAEDFPAPAMADPAYRMTFVYGNIIKKDGTLGSVIHYGGDHFDSATGAAWGEPIFRQGTLYFFNNTVYTTSTEGYMFQLSTTLEKAEVWNNIFLFAATNTKKYMRMTQYQIDPPPTSSTYNWIPGGVMNLGKNWATTGWSNSDYNLAGALTGSANVLTGASAPFDTTTYVPLASSAVLNVGQANVSGASAHVVNYQITPTAGVPTISARTVNGGTIDLGAVEK
jgi:hypothetical protein